METVQIQIDNLKCGGCESTIKKGLLKIKGVTDVNIILNESLVQISYGGQSKHELYIHTLSKLGYPPKGTSNTFQKVKSYVSCAVGRISN